MQCFEEILYGKEICLSRVVWAFFFLQEILFAIMSEMSTFICSCHESDIL